MDFENYANRILSIKDYEFFEKPENNVKEVSRLTVVDSETTKNCSKNKIFSV